MLPIWRRYAKLRTQLYPYLLAADAEYRRTGVPLMRHLALAYPTDAAAVAREDEFLFGPDLLAAPVLAQRRARSASLYLPGGRWIDFWKGVAYDELQRRPDARAAPRSSRASARRPSRRRWVSCRCSPAPAR